MHRVVETAERLQKARTAFLAADRTWSLFDNMDAYVETILWYRREEARAALDALIAKERRAWEAERASGEEKEEPGALLA